MWNTILIERTICFHEFLYYEGVKVSNYVYKFFRGALCWTWIAFFPPLLPGVQQTKLFFSFEDTKNFFSSLICFTKGPIRTLCKDWRNEVNSPQNFTLAKAEISCKVLKWMTRI